MRKVPVFISFDYNNDLDLYNLLLGQSKHEDSPFEITNWSVKDASPQWVADGARNGVLDAVPANNGVPNAVARCPHCAQPIAVVSLLVAPAAAADA